MATKKKASDGGAAEVAENLSEEQKQGYRGVAVDPTPNENYTVAGRAKNAPTPETDEALEKEAKAAASASEEERAEAGE